MKKMLKLMSIILLILLSLTGCQNKEQLSNGSIYLDNMMSKPKKKGDKIDDAKERILKAYNNTCEESEFLTTVVNYTNIDELKNKDIECTDLKIKIAVLNKDEAGVLLMDYENEYISSILVDENFDYTQIEYNENNEYSDNDYVRGSFDFNNLDKSMFNTQLIIEDYNLWELITSEDTKVRWAVKSGDEYNHYTAVTLRNDSKNLDLSVLILNNIIKDIVLVDEDNSKYILFLVNGPDKDDSFYHYFITYISLLSTFEDEVSQERLKLWTERVTDGEYEMIKQAQENMLNTFEEK